MSETPGAHQRPLLETLELFSGESVQIITAHRLLNSVSLQCRAPRKTLSEWREGALILGHVPPPFILLYCHTHTMQTCNLIMHTAPLHSVERPKEVLDSITLSIRPDHNLSLQHCLPPFRSFLSFLGIPFLHSLHLLPRLLHFGLCLPNRP